MNNKTKILFTDLDETLLTSSKEVSPSDLASINSIVEHGHKFVVATGRPLYSALKLSEMLGFIRPGFYIIASNGGIVYDCTSRKVLIRNTVPFEQVRFVFEAASKAGIHIQTYTDDTIVALRETPEIIKYSNTILMPYEILSSIPEELPYEPPKIIAISNASNSREILSDFRASVAPYIEGKLNTVFSTEQLLEFLPLASSKGNAVRSLCELFDIPIDNSIACGDQENDISMIEAAGIGVAVNNASPQAKAAADYVTARTNNENAITEVIERFILM